jgi:hypothetical protein
MFVEVVFVLRLHRGLIYADQNEVRKTNFNADPLCNMSFGFVKQFGRYNMRADRQTNMAFL